MALNGKQTEALLNWMMEKPQRFVEDQLSLLGAGVRDARLHDSCMALFDAGVFEVSPPPLPKETPVTFTNDMQRAMAACPPGVPVVLDLLGTVSQLKVVGLKQGEIAGAKTPVVVLTAMGASPVDIEEND